MLKIVLFQFSSSYGCQLKCQKISSPATAEYTNSHWESGHNFKNTSLLLLRLERQIKLNMMYQTKRKQMIFFFIFFNEKCSFLSFFHYKRCGICISSFFCNLFSLTVKNVHCNLGKCTLLH